MAQSLWSPVGVVGSGSGESRVTLPLNPGDHVKTPSYMDDHITAPIHIDDGCDVAPAPPVVCTSEVVAEPMVNEQPCHPEQLANEPLPEPQTIEPLKQDTMDPQDLTDPTETGREIGDIMSMDEGKLNCFVCDTTRPASSNSHFLNVFKSEVALGQQLKQRLEGVLSVELREEQNAGQLVCTKCMQQLESIESLASTLRSAYNATCIAHTPEDNGVGSELPSMKFKVVNMGASHFYLYASQGLANSGVKLNEAEETPEPTLVQPKIEPVESAANTPTVTPKKQAGRKRKSTVPHRILNQDVHDEPKQGPSRPTRRSSLDDVDFTVHYGSETDVDDLLEDDDYLPDRPVVIKRKRGRPKGSKSKKKGPAVPESIEPITKDDVPPLDGLSAEALDTPEGSTPEVVNTSPRRKPGRPKGRKNSHKKGAGVSSERRSSGAGTLSTSVPLPCDTCHKTFDSMYKLTRHQLTHSEERPFKCTQCDHQFKAKYHLDRHMQIHSGIKPHVCVTCGVGFREKHQLAEHELVHTGETPHACDQCDQKFQKAIALKLHMYDHTGEWPFKCMVCNQGFLRESELKEHYTLHTGEKPFRCDQCGDSFRLANTLKVHMRRHSGIKPYVCEICNHRFAAANTLKEHHRTHSGERNFLCQTCGASFVHQSGLVQHTKTHLAQEDRKHVCPYCQRRFNEVAILKRHMRIHTGERPYMCSKCGKAFRRPGELSMHNRYHSNDRRHICVTCNKSFFTRSHLKRHQATHNNSMLEGATSSRPGAPQRLSENAPTNAQPSSATPPNPPPGVSRPYHRPEASSFHPDGIHVCMICSKQFPTIEHLTKHISRVHNPSMSVLEEQMSSVATIASEDYSNAAYNADDLGLPYVHPLQIIPQ